MIDSLPPNAYWTGNTITLQGIFKNLAGQLADPTTVVCNVLSPAGVATSLSTTRQSTGIYTATFDTAVYDVQGPYWYSFTGTGSIEAKQPNVLYVNLSPV